MRRIVVIAAGMPGISCAARIKHLVPGCELNVITPVLATGQDAQKGPAGKRYAVDVPHPDMLSSHEIAVLEAQDIMPDLAQREISLTSSRGKLAIRYTDLVVEVPATVRLPRSLHQAQNVFTWPAPGFTATPDALDAALLEAKRKELPVAVTGNGAAALEAVFLVREAGAKAVWLHTTDSAPTLDPHLLALVLKTLGPDVTHIPLPGVTSSQLVYHLNENRTLLENLSGPGGDPLEVSCCLWTSPLMARHPILREDGVTLDPFGRIEAVEGAAANLGLHLMGSGSAIPAANLADGAIQAPAYPGSEEAAGLSIAVTVARLLDAERTCRGPFQGALGAHAVSTNDIQFCLAGFTLAEAQNLGLDAEQAVVSAPEENGRPTQSRLVLSIICEKKSRKLIGVQVLGVGTRTAEAEGLFGLGLAALADGVCLEALIQREWSGLPARLLGNAAFIIANKFDTVVQGISPDDFLASRQAGAEFFTLDLRSRSEWMEGHLPEAYNIPLPQLKKRLQDEVPRFTPLVLVCANSSDAHAAAVRLAGLGATDLYVLEGGMDLWPYAVDKSV